MLVVLGGSLWRTAVDKILRVQVVVRMWCPRLKVSCFAFRIEPTTWIYYSLCNCQVRAWSSELIRPMFGRPYLREWVMWEHAPQSLLLCDLWLTYWKQWNLMKGDLQAFGSTSWADVSGMDPQLQGGYMYVCWYVSKLSIKQLVKSRHDIIWIWDP